MSKVVLIAHTIVRANALERLGYSPHLSVSGARTETDADELAEFAGRNCYQSFNRPNPKTATNSAYLGNIQRQSHESVFEHATATFYIDSSRSFLTEAERHRFTSYSVTSQRYVDVTELGYHKPPALRDNSEYGEILAEVWNTARQGYETLVDCLTEDGLPRKKAREAARAVLPGMTASPMVVSGNLRCWRDVLRKRWHVAADDEMQEVAGTILAALRSIAPHTFQDFPDEPFSDKKPEPSGPSEYEIQNLLLKIEQLKAEVQESIYGH